MGNEIDADADPLAVNKHLILAFASPVVAYPWPDSGDLNEELRNVILAAQREQPAGLVRSNVGGWHSASDFLDWDIAATKILRQRIRRMTMGITHATTATADKQIRFDYKLDGWANVSRHGDYNSVHNHPGCVWSGTYYVSSGVPRPETPVNGRLELLDPRGGVGMMQPEGSVLHPRYVITPTPGLMVMFPSWLNHLVHPFFGDGERISIAFNISVEKAV